MPTWECGLCTLDEVLAELRQKAGEQCGDNCKGECSGEVTGTPFCPQSERDKVLDELIEWCGLDSMIVEKEMQKSYNFVYMRFMKKMVELRAGEP